jgi:hypothetical protein
MGSASKAAVIRSGHGVSKLPQVDGRGSTRKKRLRRVGIMIHRPRRIYQASASGFRAEHIPSATGCRALMAVIGEPRISVVSLGFPVVGGAALAAGCIAVLICVSRHKR